MFGKPEWFVNKTKGWGLRPVTWQGWAYTGAWTGAIAFPFLMILFWGPGVSNAILWMLFSTAALLWDVRSIKKAQHRAYLNRPADLYIDDEGNASLATKKFDMEVRR